MNGIDLRYLCKVIGNLSGVPIRIFQEEKMVFYHSVVALPKDPMELYREEIRRITANIGYFVTKQFHYYGVVNSGDVKIVIGPSKQVSESAQELRELGFQADVPAEDMDEFVEGMKSIVCMPLESIMQTLCTINYILNDEKLELEDITIYEAEQNDLKELLERQRSTRVLSQAASADEPQLQEHNTYTQEQQILRMVRKGDTASLRQWIASAPAIRGGTLASDQLRQMKNTFVVTATLVSRAAIQGGLSTEDAFSLSDAYIQKCELLNALDRITNLQYHMVLEFTQRVERIRFGGKPTQLTLAVTNYVQHHLSEPIRAEDIARELYMSRPYLSAKFKEETGETLTDFILKEKTEEAKRLLRYSDKSFTAIGFYLGFSSVGHFSQVFKRYAGRTPTEYREKYSK
ncbi:MAG: helix-turn-helix domain-containing protein [Oscillospiraceae bacterium]|nr:helix-turn-helix domain-containing protein [Oscillospiraceae bacterium]